MDHLFAENIAIEAGAIKRCPKHDHVTIDQQDDEAKRKAFAIATNRTNSGELKVDRIKLLKAINDVIKNSSFECEECQREKHED